MKRSDTFRIVVDSPVPSLSFDVWSEHDPSVPYGKMYWFAQVVGCVGVGEGDTKVQAMEQATILFLSVQIRKIQTGRWALRIRKNEE